MDDSPRHRSGADDGALSSVEVPAWEADAGGVGLRVEGQVAIGRRRASGGGPPQLTCHFSRLAAPDSEGAHFTCRRHFDRLDHQAAWEEEARRMLASVAADHVRPADLEHLAVAFSLYTFFILHRFSFAELVEVEISAVIKVPAPAAPSTSSPDLRLFLPVEDYRYLHSAFGDGVGMQAESGGGPCRSASAAAVEALQTVTPGEPGSCPICLDDFDAAAQLLAMPCLHQFHEVCLKEWLMRSNSCPVCRFPLPVDAE